MDERFEAALLRQIDDALEREHTAQNLGVLRRSLGRIYVDQTDEATKEIWSVLPEGAPVEAYSQPGIGDRLLQAAEDQLPRERRDVFAMILERANTTRSVEPTEQERQDGWTTVDEFYALLESSRATYRARFAVNQPE